MTKVDVIIAGTVTEEVIVTTPQPTVPPPALTPDVGLVELEMVTATSIWMTGPSPPDKPGRAPGDMWLGDDGDIYQWNGSSWINTGVNISSSDTPEQVLAKLITVDGSGSGLDADLLDGHDSSYFATDADMTAAEGALAALDDRMDLVEIKNGQQDTAIDSADTRLDAVEAKNTAQDGRLTSVENKNTAQDAAIAANTGSISTINTEQDAQDAAIADLDSTKVDDGPHDGLVYGRKDGSWATVIGGATTDDNPPPGPLQDGQLWWKSSTGVSYIWYADADTAQWVQFAGGGIIASEPYTFQLADMSLHSISSGCVAFNDKVDGTGNNMLTFYDSGIIGFKGTGTTPRDFTIQGLNGVLLIDSSAGAVVQIAEGLTVGAAASFMAGVSVTGALSAGSFSTSGGMTLTGGVSAGNQIATTSSVRGNAGLYAISDATFGMVVSGAIRYITVIGTSYCFNCNGANGDMSWMQPGGYNWFARASDAAFIIRGQAYKPAGGPWVDASDERIKTVTGDYESGLDQILALQPVRYMFKGNDTPGPPEDKPEDPVTEVDEDTGEITVTDPPVVKPMSAPTAPYWNSPHRKSVEDGTEFIGLVAQATETVMPEMVTRATAFIDGVEVDDLRNLDTTPLVFALINAIKTLTARIEALEAKDGA